MRRRRAVRGCSRRVQVRSVGAVLCCAVRAGLSRIVLFYRLFYYGRYKRSVPPCALLQVLSFPLVSSLFPAGLAEVGRDWHEWNGRRELALARTTGAAQIEKEPRWPPAGSLLL